MRADMMPHRAPVLAAWLAALLVAVLGLLAPAPAAAHGGHAHHHAQAAAEAADAVLGELAPEAEDSLAAAEAPLPCGGAVCCSAGHGCCAALAGGSPPTVAQPRAPPPAPVLVGLPAGLGAATLPEPPRPFR